MKKTLTVILIIGLITSSYAFMKPSNLRKAATKKASREVKDPSLYAESEATAIYNTAYYNQTLDHFNYADGNHSRKWSQRYLFNSANWGGNLTKSPLFFYCGNEADITVFWNNSGYVTDVLPVALKAYVLFMEHRYFGVSLPFGNESYTGTNMLYLTTEQALADYIEFIHYYKNEVLFCPDCPVIAFGGSYGGMLAAWIRMKFPNVVDGALAASAPILLFDNVVPPELAYQIVTYDFANSSASPQCAQLIKQGFNILDSYIEDSEGSEYEDLNVQFNLCTNMTSNAEISDLENYLSGAYFSMAMGDYPYPANFLGPMPAYPVNYSCQAFIGLSNSSADVDILQAMYNSAMIFYNYENATQCNEIFSDGVSDISDDGWGVLSCTEMVLPMSSGVNDMFPLDPWNYTANTIACEEQWGTQCRYSWALDFYGGWNIEEDFQYYSNIFFSNGILDPWRAGGVQQNLSSSLPAYVMPSAHHLDLRLPNKADPIAVQLTRAVELVYIRNWIQEKHNKTESRNTAKIEA